LALESGHLNYNSTRISITSQAVFPARFFSVFPDWVSRLVSRLAAEQVLRRAVVPVQPDALRERAVLPDEPLEQPAATPPVAPIQPAVAGCYAPALQAVLPGLAGSVLASWGAPAVQDVAAWEPLADSAVRDVAAWEPSGGFPAQDVAAWEPWGDFPDQDVVRSALPDVLREQEPWGDFPAPAGPVRRLRGAVPASYAAWARLPDAPHDRRESAY
jgi:hypothetical protein